MRAGAIARLAPWLLAVAGGLAWAACHGRGTLPLASWLALGPLVLLLGHRRGWAFGWLHGVVYWLAAIPWIRPTLETYGGLSGWLSVPLLLLVCVYLGAYHGLFALLGRRLWRRGGAAALVGLPALWVALEWLRAHLISGFPWNLAAYAWTEVPGALPIAAWIGAYGVSFLLVLANVGLTLAVAAAVPAGLWASGAPLAREHLVADRGQPARRRRAGVAAVLACLAVLAIGARWGAAAAGPGAGEPRGLGPTVPVRLLQPNTENLVTWDAERARQGYERIFELSYRACDELGALLVWPESAAWPYAWGTSPQLRRDLEALTAAGCPVLFNSTDERPEGYYNSVLLLDESGVVASYDKRHLVPFGEYVPLANVFFFLDKIARNAGAYMAGREVAPAALEAAVAWPGDLFRGHLSGRGGRTGAGRGDDPGDRHQRRLVRRHQRPVAALPRRALPRRREPAALRARRAYRRLGGRRAGRFRATAARGRRAGRAGGPHPRRHGLEPLRPLAVAGARERLGRRAVCYIPRPQEAPMIAADTEQQMENLAERLETLRGYL